MVATYSGGFQYFKYGVPKYCALFLEHLLANGNIINLGSKPKSKFFKMPNMVFKVLNNPNIKIIFFILNTMEEEQKVRESYKKRLDRYKNYNIKEYLHYIDGYKLKTDYYFIQYIPNGLKNKIVLDIGPFVPFDAVYWASTVKEYHAIDLSQEVVDFGNQYIKKELQEDLVKKIKYQQANALNLPYQDNYFDVVYAFSTIDHVPGKERRDKIFSEIARVTKKRGFVIITLPNRLNFIYYYRNMRLQKKGKYPISLEIWYTPKELKKILIKNNLRPLIFNSSAGDNTRDVPVISDIYNMLVRKFGVRMGWLAQKY